LLAKFVIINNLSLSLKKEVCQAEWQRALDEFQSWKGSFYIETLLGSYSKARNKKQKAEKWNEKSNRLQNKIII